MSIPLPPKEQDLPKEKMDVDELVKADEQRGAVVHVSPLSMLVGLLESFRSKCRSWDGGAKQIERRSKAHEKGGENVGDASLPPLRLSQALTELFSMGGHADHHSSCTSQELVETCRRHDSSRTKRTGRLLAQL